MSDDASKRLIANYEAIQADLAEVLRQCSRAPDAVKLVAVTKYVELATSLPLLSAGCVDFGESRPQELVEKAIAADAMSLASPIHWHLIGHLQRNKARRLVERATWIHSIDSLRLLKSLGVLTNELQVSPRCLLEVNVSGDASKHGFALEDMDGVLQQVEQLGEMAPPIVGLMAMASREGGAEQARRNFESLRQLRDALREHCPDNVSLDELSMGMSGDWKDAIAEGATLVRIGSALFKGIL